MTFLNAARPLVTENDSIIIRINGNKDGAISVLIEPHVKLHAPDTEDAELAALQAALAMPLHLRFKADTVNLDQALSEALSGMSQARRSTVSALTAYEEAQAEARNHAALAAQQKKAKAAKAPASTAKGKAKAPADSPVAKPLPEATAKPVEQAAEPATTPSPTLPASEQQTSIFG